MTASNLVLSIFPGIDLLGRAFEEEGFCVVRGPDLLWGGDIRIFHPPSGVFAGVIGGPPCQAFSALAPLIRAQGREPRFGNLIPEFERVVREAQPDWYLMENVPAAPIPMIDGYWAVATLILNNRWLGEEQNRVRRLSFSTRGDLDPSELDVSPDLVALEQPITFEAVISGNGFGSGSEYYARTGQAMLSAPTNVPVKIGGSGKVKVTYRKVGGTVTASDGGHSDHPRAVKMERYSIRDACRLQGMPEDFLESAPFTKDGKLKAIANGVPLPMGRAIARAVKRALEAPNA